MTTITDPYGDTFTYYPDGADIMVIRSFDDPATPIICFTQPVADSPIAATIDRTGKHTVTYLDGAGARLSKSSQKDADSGSWS